MPYKFKRSNYDPKKKASSDIPAAGSIVAVQIVSKKEVADFDWAGTIETKSSKGRPMLRIHTKVCKGQDGEGCWIMEYIVLDNDYADQNIGSMLDALGFDMDGGVAGYNVTPSLIEHKRAYVRIKHEEYNGESRPRIAYWISPSRYVDLDLDPIGDVADEPESVNEPDVEVFDEEGEPF
jgi:hypothetical protein